MEVVGWILFIMWLALSALVIYQTVISIKASHIGGSVTIMISLVFVLIAYGGWTIAWILDDAYVFVGFVLFLICGYIAKRLVENHQLVYGKNKTTSLIHGFTVPSGIIGVYILILLKCAFMLIVSMFKDMNDEMERNARADDAADKFLRDRVPRIEPMNYENECEAAYRSYIKSTGTEDSARNHEEFKKKYFHHIYS